MARTVAAGAIVEVALVGRHLGQRTLNLLHYSLPDAPALGVDYTPYATDFVTQLNLAGGLLEKYLNCISVDFTLEEIRLQVLSPIRYSFQSFAQVDVIGNVEAAALPPNDGVTLQKKNDNTGRHNRGSVHMPAVPTTFISNGQVSGTGLAAYAVLAGELTEVVPVTVLAVTLSHTPVIFNRVNPAASPIFDAVETKLTSRVNRRRTVGLGE